MHFTAHGTTRPDGASGEQVWLVLSGDVALPQICQRCLGAVDVPVAFKREFRFVATEDLAASEDEASEEDVLALSRDFHLMDLIEDELLMALPVVPKHEVCPEPVKLQVADPDFVDEVALLALPCSCAGYETMPVIRDAFLAALPPGHPLAQHKTIPAQALATDPSTRTMKTHNIRSNP